MKKIIFSTYVVTAVLIATCCQQKKTAATTEGKRLFDHYCARCHLANGSGGPTPIPSVEARDLRKIEKTKTEIAVVITDGFGKMPAFADSTSQQNISLIASYVASQIELKNGKGI